jgi:hypothetical protein
MWVTAELVLPKQESVLANLLASLTSQLPMAWLLPPEVDLIIVGAQSLNYILTT